MKRFQCPDCGNELYFDSTSCIGCGKPVGYDPRAAAMYTLVVDAAGRQSVLIGDALLVLCANARHDACNWLVPAGEANGLCLSCRHNRTIPDLSLPANLAAWRALELAQRQMFYSLLRWRLPVPTRAEEPASGLAFDILADTVTPDGTVERVLTGHHDGLITINIAEADDAVREKMRTDMREPYRTLLGHYRHEIGHYYWDRLVRDRNKTDAFRAVFGDETPDYAAALQRSYAEGPPADWQLNYISAYASAHPWEDFAETWAHYTHIVDSLETARAYGMAIEQQMGGQKPAAVAFDPYEAPDVEAVLDLWVPFTLALNSINRSMGQRDFYPFVINPPVVQKLAFIHRLVSRVEPAARISKRTDGNWMARLRQVISR